MAEAEVGGLESAAPARGGATRFPAFDGFRAIAALSVLATHVAFASGYQYRSDTFGPYLARLDVGVAIFFVISGFLLYRPFVAAHFEQRATIPYGEFMRRRVLRIFPAYWLALTIVAFVLVAPGFESTEAGFLHYSLLSAFSFEHAAGGPVQQSWTLSTEMCFYLLLPLFALLLAKRARPAERQLRVELVAVAVLYAISVAYRLSIIAADVNDAHLGWMTTWLPGKLDWFALGMLLAVVSAWCAHRRVAPPARLDSRWAPAICWVLAGVSFWAASTRIGLPRDPVGHTAAEILATQLLFGLTAFFLLIPGIFGPQDRGIIRGFLRNPLVQWVGLISYGIYLWHEAWINKFLDWFDEVIFSTSVLGMLTFVLALTIVSAAISYYVLERPLLRRNTGPVRRGAARTS